MTRVIDYRQMIENEPFVSMRLSYDDGAWNVWYVSKNIERYGYSHEEFMNGTTSWMDIVHPDDRVLTVRLADDYMRLHLDRFRLQYRIITRSGESVNVTEFSHINRDDEGRVLCVDSVLLNAASAQLEKEIAANHFRQQEVFNDILLSLHDADYETSLQIILNRAGEYLDTSRALLFKDSEDHKTCKVVYEWLNKGITSIMELDYAVTYATEMPEIYVALQKTGMLLVNAGEIPENCREEFEKEGLISSAIFAVYLRGEHYGFVCFDDCVVPRKWDADTASFLKNISNLISSVLYHQAQDRQLAANEEKVRQIAFTDHLTKLPNRFRCDQDLAAAIERLQGMGESKAYALFIDMDDFKIVNDCYGHDYGDGVLIAFASFAGSLIGGEDDTEGGNRVYRFGGDEFVIILSQTDDRPVDFYLQALLERARRPWYSLGKEFYCSLSIGVVEFGATGDTTQSIIKKADIAMYHAKKSGKNNFAWYREGLDSDSLHRTEMEGLLRHAMENDFAGCAIHYQPYSDTKTRQIVGAEALLRLRGTDGGLVLPEQFLSLAEYLGLMVPLGEFVMDRAARQCRVINEMRGLADFTITINMSNKELRQKNVVKRTEEILRGAGVKFENIIISINESAALGETEKMLRVAEGLRALGVRVALNEFGSGSSSFINMRDLPVDIIKVSSEYLEDIEDEFTGAFLKLVTDLGHFAGKTICMNDVETRGQYAFCCDVNIDLVQGFLFHRPDDERALLSTIAPSFTRVFRHKETKKLK